MASAKPRSTKAKRSLRRRQSTVRARSGSNRSETNSRRRRAARRSARAKSSTSNGIASKAQNQDGAPKFICVSSRQLFPDRLRQEQLCEEQPQARHDTGREQIAVLLILFHRHRRLLQLVDIGKNLLERFRVGGAVKLAVGALRYFFQPRFVEMHALVLINDISKHVGERLAILRIENRRRSDAIDSGPDGVKANLQRLNSFRCGIRWNLAGVVFAVGQENDDAALGPFVIQPV